MPRVEGTITDPQAAGFANTRCRTLADLMASLDRTLPQFALEVVRDFENLTGANDNAEVIKDGSFTDGRSQVTKQNVAELKFVAEQIAAVFNTSDYRALVNNWVVNGAPLF